MLMATLVRHGVGPAGWSSVGNTMLATLALPSYLNGAGRTINASGTLLPELRLLPVAATVMPAVVAWQMQVALDRFIESIGGDLCRLTGRRLTAALRLVPLALAAVVAVAFVPPLLLQLDASQEQTDAISWILGLNLFVAAAAAASIRAFPSAFHLVSCPPFAVRWCRSTF